jgi:hypothetical protein
VDREVTAVEPSASMRTRRPKDRPAIDATVFDGSLVLVVSEP